MVKTAHILVLGAAFAVGRSVTTTSSTDCNVDESSRSDCGYVGIDQSGCEGKGCCWAESSTANVPWCFASGGDVGSDDGAPPVVNSEGVAFVHLFEWSWADVAAECEDFLGPKGFTAVQVSPPMEHIQGDQWWTRYQPVSYNLTSRSGDEAGFEDMTARCNAVGVQIYADGVVNHMAAAPSSSAQGTGGTYYGPGRKFEPYNYDPEMMHHTSGNSNSNCAVTDYTNLANVQECDLVGLVDLNTEEDAVRQTIGAYITKLHTLGASGVRIDAAKHINTDSLGAFLGYAPSDMFVFQEVIYGAGEASQPEMYTQNGDVTEFRFGTNLYDNFKEGATGKVQYLSTFGPSWGMIDSESAVTFTDNHDTQRSASNVMTYKMGQNYNVANYFMLAHDYGYPKVMSSYYFTDTDAGPPSTPVNGGAGCDGQNWVCEHRRTGIANMVAFRKAAAGVATSDWQSGNSGNGVAFGRGTTAFIAINMDTNSYWSAELTTQVPDGTYTNAIDGTTQITVSGGKVSVNVPTVDAVAIYVE